MKTKFLVAALIGCISLTLAVTTVRAEPGKPSGNPWMPVAENDQVKVELSPSTVGYMTVEGVRHVRVGGRMTYKDTGLIDFTVFVVPASACRAGSGMLVTVPIDVNQKSYSTQFVLQGGTLASIVADLLCEAHTKTQESAASRSNGRSLTLNQI